MPIIEKIKILSYGLDFIKSIISCQDLVSYIHASITLINNGVNSAIRVNDIVKGIQKNNVPLIILGTLNKIINEIYLGIIKTKEKKLNKSQNNFEK